MTKISNNGKLKLTSVKVHVDLSENFRKLTVNTTFNLQKLVNRCVDLYNTDEAFRNKIHSHNRLATSGSI